jgi:phosphoribosylamine---glycine ligase
VKLLVVGSGGREHALAWKLAQQHQVSCCPGNAGISSVAECVDIPATDINRIADHARRERFDLTVVGPEAPLVDGIADEFERLGLPVFGPVRAAARLEGDKAFAKQLMQEQGIPTARFGTFAEYVAARSYLEQTGAPVVVKASGLAAGKGAVICRSRDEAEETLRRMMVEHELGEAGATVVIEEFLEGEEASVIGVCDGERVAMFPSSQDHKALLDGDRGPNTGGMGAYAPAPVVTRELLGRIERDVFRPLLAGFRKMGIEYRGVIYAGMMLTADGPKVLEFNCRFGDPETQALLPLLESDLAELLLACGRGSLSGVEPRWSGNWALTVVAASAGYPGAYPKGKVIEGLDGLQNADRRLQNAECRTPDPRPQAVVFHAGTKLDGGHVVTNGGRVLAVTGIGTSLQQARERAYERLGTISFDGMQFRSDIGRRGLARLGTPTT